MIGLADAVADSVKGFLALVAVAAVVFGVTCGVILSGCLPTSVPDSVRPHAAPTCPCPDTGPCCPCPAPKMPRAED